MIEAGNEAPAPAGTVFLLTHSGVMTQQGGARLWHAVEAGPGAAPGGPTAAQLRALRRERARRQHPAGSAHRSAAPRGTGSAGNAPARFEVFDSLNRCWSPVPPTAGPWQIADALCWVLPDGRLLVGGLSSATYSTYDPASHRWTTTRTKSGRGEASVTATQRKPGAEPVVIIRLGEAQPAAASSC